MQLEWLSVNETPADENFQYHSFHDLDPGMNVVDHRDPDLPTIGIVDANGKIQSPPQQFQLIEKPASATPRRRTYFVLILNITFFVIFGLSALVWRLSQRQSQSKDGKTVTR